MEPARVHLGHLQGLKFEYLDEGENHYYYVEKG